MRILIIILSTVLMSCDKIHNNNSTLIQNVLLVDGSGSKPKITSVRFKDSLILEIGALKSLKGELVIDGTDLALSPGFIDSHSHIDWSVDEEMESAVSQGITTVVLGVDGFSQYPLNKFFATLRKKPSRLNIASFSGHNTIRSKIMGQDFRREATDIEIDQMQTLIAADMKAGALGLSTGLEYNPGPYSTTHELIELCKLTSTFGGIYSSHIRSYDRTFEEAVDEVLEIGEKVQLPVHFDHLQLGRKNMFHKASELLSKLDSARAQGINVTADVYPYTRWSSSLLILIPGDSKDDINEAQYAIDQIVAPENLKFLTFFPDTTYIGKTLAEIAKVRKEKPAETLINLIQMVLNGTNHTKKPAARIIAKSMIEEDNLTFLAWQHTNISTDATIGHPRMWGSFPKYFNLNQNVPIEMRIQKMTSTSAKNRELKNLGIIETGSFADLVLFNPNELKDNATFDQPNMQSSGIVSVWVSGKLVFDQNKLTGKFPGRVIKRK